MADGSLTANLDLSLYVLGRVKFTRLVHTLNRSFKLNSMDRVRVERYKSGGGGTRRLLTILVRLEQLLLLVILDLQSIYAKVIQVKRPQIFLNLLLKSCFFPGWVIINGLLSSVHFLSFFNQVRMRILCILSLVSFNNTLKKLLLLLVHCFSICDLVLLL